MRVYSEMLRTDRANEAANCDSAQRSFDDFRIITAVGKGTYGRVYKAIDTATRQYLLAYQPTHDTVI